MQDVNPCRGCVCASCCLSEKNGAPYLCSRRRCNACEQTDTILKLTYCDDTVRLDKEGEFFTL